MNLHRIKNIFLYGGEEKQDYERVRKELCEINRRGIIVYAGIVIVIVSVMTLLSFFFPVFESSRTTYLVCVAASLLFLVLAAGPAKNNIPVTTAVVYAFSAMLLGVGIGLGTAVEPGQASMSYAVLMFAVPLLFVDVPLRTDGMTILGILVYMIAASRTQSAEMFQFNRSVIFPYGVICLILSSIIMKIKIHSFVLQNRESMLEEIKKLNDDLSDSQAMLEELTAEQELRIHEITALNERLEEAVSQAEAANRAKSAFLFNMSHDIRTPMNAILGYAQLIEEHKEDQERCMEYLKKIQSSGDFLLSLINDVLEMARIDSGKLRLEEQPCTIALISEEISSVYGEMMKEKNIDFTQTVDVQTSRVWGDPVKLNEIFMNLISNAYKYTPEGGRVSVSVTELPGDREGWVNIRTVISDNGIGMSPEFLPTIFEEFSREKSATETRIQGTGLGMPIVKKLVELMNGTITVESEPGKGSTFTVVLPRRIADGPDFGSADREDVDTACLAGRRILLAEDNEFNAEITMTTLNDLGMIVEHAGDGIICVDMLSGAEAGYYDLILMDIQMPGMDGYQATRRIRQMQDPVRAGIPIVALTANAFAEDKQNAMDAGMNGHLAKPIDREKLTETLTRLLCGQQGR